MRFFDWLMNRKQDADPRIAKLDLVIHRRVPPGERVLFTFFGCLGAWMAGALVHDNVLYDMKVASHYDKRIREHASQIQTAENTELQTLENRIYDAAKRGGAEVDELKALVAASSRYNPDIGHVPADYRSVVILDPTRAGVVGDTLRSDNALSLNIAAAMYRNIRSREDNRTKAVGIFFAGKNAVENAIAETFKDAEQISRRNRGMYASVQVEKYNKEMDTLNWVEHIPNKGIRSAIYTALKLMDRPEELRRAYR